MEEFFYLTGMYPISIDSLIEILLLKSKIIKEAGETAVRWMIQQNLLLKEEVLCQILREITGIMCSVCFTGTDAAFLIDSRLNLYEQQSTVNENMPLRDLYYVAEEMKRLVPVSKLYQRTRVKIPTPRFVVFYNGLEEQPAETVLKLSDLYENGGGDPELELIVRQININRGYNDSILEKCESLGGYVVFVEKVREKTEAGMKVEDAVTKAVDECIREGVLSEFFAEHRSEVIEMGIFEYDAELHDQVLREESWLKGKAEDVLELLEELAAVPSKLREEILSQKDVNILKTWLKAAAKAESLEEWEKLRKR